MSTQNQASNYPNKEKNNKENSGMDQVKLSHDQVKQSQKQSQVTSS